MAPYCDGDADWYQYSMDDDFPPLCSSASPLALLSAQDYPLPIAIAPPPHLSRSIGDEFIEGSCHGVLAAAGHCPSSGLMNLREADESYYGLPAFFSAPPAAGDQYYFSNQLPPAPVEIATVGLNDALLQPLGDIDLEAFDTADEHKTPLHDHTTILPPADQHPVGQDYAGVDFLEDQKAMVIADTFRPRAHAFEFEMAMNPHADHRQEANSVPALLPPPPLSLPRQRARGRRTGEYRSSVPAGKTRLDHIGFEELRKYFYMPITRAAREMNVGLTVLKKRCRELGIARWPHRKMKSLKSLILNVQEMGSGMNAAAVQEELAALETYCALMENNPAIELTEHTKKLRQACFKESYKRRRAAAVNVIDHCYDFGNQYHHHQLPPPPSSSAECHGHDSSFFGY